MNLVYLWVENYRCFHETGIHFTNKYEIVVEINGNSSDSAAAGETPGQERMPKTYLVKFETRENTLSAKDFYGKGVSNFRIFVAENGKGKTTLFELLDLVLQKRSSSIPTRIILGVEEEEDKLEFWKINFGAGQEVNLKGKLPGGRDPEPVKDIQDAGSWVWKYAIYYNDPGREERLESIKRQIDFVCAHEIGEINEWLRFPIPPQLKIEPSLAWDELEKERAYLVDEIKGIEKKEKEGIYSNYNNEIRTFDRRLNRLISACGTWIERKCRSLGKERIKYILRKVCEVIIYIYCDSVDLDHLENLTKSSETIASWIEDLEEAEDHIYGEKNIWDQIFDIFKPSYKYGQDKLDQLEVVANQLKEIEESPRNQNGEGIALRIHDGSRGRETGQEAHNKLKVFHEAYAKFVEGKRKYDFLSFSWGMSSGEQSMLNTFSYIDYFLKGWDKNAATDKDTFILMLDEIDLSLHPRWQQEYMKRLTDFLNTVLGEKQTVQLLLATHSPIVLSDVPGEFITYFKGETENQLYSKVDTERQGRRTFGANIYDIYNDSFYFNKGDSAGVIGEVAAEKARNVLENLEKMEKTDDAAAGQSRNKEKLLQDCRREIEYFDDDVLKRVLLRRWKKAIFHCNIEQVKTAQLCLEQLSPDDFSEVKALIAEKMSRNKIKRQD